MTKKDILEREKIIKEIQNEKWGIDTRRPAERFKPLDTDNGDGVEECDNITAVINQLNDAILDFETMENIKDWRKESPNIWTACLMYVGKKVFPDNESKRILKSKEKQPSNLLHVENQTINKYSDAIMDRLIEHYIYCSALRDMPVDIYDFAFFLNIHNETIFLYDARLTRTNTAIRKKITSLEEKSLKSIAVSGKRSTVGTLATLNKKFGWNQPDKEIYIESTDVSAVGLPDLSAKNLLNG